MQKIRFVAIFVSLALVLSTNLCSLGSAFASTPASREVSSEKQCHASASSKSRVPQPCHKGSLCCHDLIATHAFNADIGRKLTESVTPLLLSSNVTSIPLPKPLFTYAPGPSPPFVDSLSPNEQFQLSFSVHAPPLLS